MRKDHDIQILILGSKGMLGKYVKTYLEKVAMYRVSEINRDKFDIFNEYTQGTLSKTIERICSMRYTYIINCMGVTNKREVTSSEMYVVNAYFPFILATIGKRYDIILIHPTTDCIYSGLKGMYTEKDIPDCNNDYGVSKCLGESVNLLGNVYVIRASIIGENGVGSLVDWVKENKGQTINGYTNHFWNGVTCLEYAKKIEEYISTPIKNFPNRICFIRSSYKGEDKISKYDLIREVSNVYQLNINVIPFDKDVKCDRSLKGCMTRDIVEQIIEMKEFGERYF